MMDKRKSNPKEDVYLTRELNLTVTKLIAPVRNPNNKQDKVKSLYLARQRRTKEEHSKCLTADTISSKRCKAS